MARRTPIWQRAQRWYYVITSHRPSQLAWRAVRIVQRRLFPLLPGPAPVGTDELLAPRDNAGWEEILRRQLSLRVARGRFDDRVHALLQGEFCFLNQSRKLGPCADAPLENIEPVSHLWRFHLNYQEYLLDLLAADRLEGPSEAKARIWPIIDSWLQANPVTRPGALGDAWHPFCLSRRIAVWLTLWRAGVVPDDQQVRWQRSLEEQTRYLERHLEWDLRGNHLLENLRTLILSGSCWEGAAADARLDRAIRLCEVQLGEQILPSGEHFERSPMYHAQMLSALLDIRDATQSPRPEFAEVCQQTIRRMAGFLERLLHPDGQVPLLSDSALEETPCPAILIEDALSFDEGNRPRAEAGDAGPSRVSIPDGPLAIESHSSKPHRHSHNVDENPTLREAFCDGYWTWRDGDDYLVFDHGPVCADELPAHAHNDLLTVEASLAGRRLLVDSGVYDYDDSEMRRDCRSTAAHNVLLVDGQEQCDLWSRFRMGYRGRPAGFARGSDGDFLWAVAAHDAYRRAGVPRLGRWIACRRGGPWIFADWAEGDRRHHLQNRIHLAPDVCASRQDESTVVISREEGDYRIRFHVPGTLSVESAWYCPDFGVRIEAPVICFEQQVHLPGMMVWTLEWEAAAGEVTVDAGEDGRTYIRWQGDHEQITWSPQALL